MSTIKGLFQKGTVSFGEAFRHAFFIALCILSIVYYQERTLHFDPSFFNWLLILNEDFYFALGRNGAVLGQALPLLIVKLGGSIKAVLVVFSFSFALCYYLFFLITEYLTRDKVASWVLILSLCLTFRQTFYYTTAEVYHGLALSIVLWSLLRRSYELTRAKQWVLYAILVAGTLWLPFFHQINLILWLFLLGAEYLSRNNFRDIKLLALMLISASWFVVKIKFFSLTDYEKGKLITLDDHLYALDHFFELPSYLYLEEWAQMELTVPIIFFVGCILFALLRSKILVTGFIIVALLGFIVLIVNTNFKGESPIMLENYYSLFGVFIAISWAVANRGLKLNGAITAVLIGLACYSTVRIVQSRWVYEYRTAYLQQITHYAAKSPDDKFIINAKNFPFEYASVPWALAFETALFSELDKNTGSSTFYLSEDPEEWGGTDSIPTFLSAPWAETWFGLSHVQSRGFDFTDRPYQLANTALSDTFTVASFESFSRNFSIIPDKEDIKIVRPIHITKVYILNESGRRLHSLPEGPNQTKIGYRIFQNGVVVAERLMALELDILPGESFISSVVVPKPLDVSKGTIIFGMFTDGFGWWGVSPPIKVEVVPD